MRRPQVPENDPKEEAEEETGDGRWLREAYEESEAIRLRDSDDDWDPVPVKVTFAKKPRHVFAFRVGAEELDEIADAAEAVGKDVGAFVREAALEKARRSRQTGRSELKRALEAARSEISEALARLR